MKYITCFLLIILLKTASVEAAAPITYKANNPYLNYVGRIDYKNPLLPRFWSPGVYVQARFSGTTLAIDINDEMLYGKYHNYIEVAIDNRTPVRLQTTGKNNHMEVATNLPKGIHTVTICKNTETGIGYLEFVGLTCAKLLPWVNTTAHKIEFIGNSITCGTGSDQSVVPCDKAEWYDQHNAYMSYGARTARMLNAQWQLTAYSGIGLIHSCCNIKFGMPEIFDRVNLQQDSLKWDFRKYTPDVVTICLGQNDGIQDSTTFCKAYVGFLQDVRQHYPKANLVMLTSPMGDDKLIKVLKSYMLGIEAAMQQSGDKKVSHYFFSRRFHAGCGDHPSIEEHALIANELTGYIKKLMAW